MPRRADFLTIPQVAERLQVSERTVRRLLKSGALIGVWWTARTICIPKQALEGPRRAARIRHDLARIGPDDPVTAATPAAGREEKPLCHPQSRRFETSSDH